MTTPLANLVIATNTWENLVDRTNELSDIATTKMVTVNQTANGEVTSGNAHVNGVFSSTTLVAGTLRGGNVQTSDTLTISTNVAIGDSLISVGSVATTNADPDQIMDTFDTGTYRTAKYIMQVNTGIGFQSSEMLVTHDGAASFITEYAVVTSNGTLGSFTTDISGSDVRLLFSPDNAVNGISFQKTMI